MLKKMSTCFLAKIYKKVYIFLFLKVLLSVFSHLEKPSDNWSKRTNQQWNPLEDFISSLLLLQRFWMFLQGLKDSTKPKARFHLRAATRLTQQFAGRNVVSKIKSSIWRSKDASKQTKQSFWKNLTSTH